MGNGSWQTTDWDRHAKAATTMSQRQIFTSSGLQAVLDPAQMKGGVRESVDSADNPSSTPIIVTCDVTGSMGVTAETIIKTGLGVIMKGIHDHKPVANPHVLIGATGDVFTDRAPLQVSQFEADNRVVDQVKDIWLEEGGGGNGGESYNLVWYFAAMHTRCDAIIKRGRKGYIFTIGDEPPHDTLPRDGIKRVFGTAAERDYTSKELLDLVSRDWEVFHLIVNPGSYSDTRWKALLGERAMPVHDLDKLGEVIVSAIRLTEGAGMDDVIGALGDPGTALVVRNAVGGLTKRGQPGTGVVRL